MGRHALIIGNDQYIDPKLKTLKSPSADARALVEVLEDQAIGGFDEVKSVLNQSGEKIRREISSFLSRKKSDDLVLVYFSGHGVLDTQGRLYLALNDTEVDLLRATAIPSTYVSDEMDNCSSKRKILILDCCHSGAFSRVGLKSGDHKSVTETTFQGNGYGRVVLTASGATQFALEGDKIDENITLSLFTHYLVDGLKNGAADKDGDGQVSLDEWYDYAYSCILEKTPNQTPHKWTYQQQGDLLIANNLNAKKKVIELPANLLPHLESSYSDIRVVAVRELGKLVRSRNKDLAELARTTLEDKLNDDSDKVKVAAREELKGLAPVNDQPQTSVPAQQDDISTPTPKDKPTERQEPVEDKMTVVVAAQQEDISAPTPKDKPTKRKKPAVEDKKVVVVPPVAKRQSPSQPKPKLKKSDFDKSGHPTKDWIEANKITLSNGMEFMCVPMGTFLMGSDRNQRDEKPKHIVDIPYNYWMGRYPVTNEQYNSYGIVKGIEHPVFNWEKKKDHPVERLNWNTAMNYCQWLNSLFHNELPFGLVLRLPTESEWEKAARGMDGREYPWGNTFDINKCNISSNYLSGLANAFVGSTTSVTTYSPKGDSPFGCADMAGNVWEWTLSLKKAYPYNANDGREDEKASGFRVLRGGTYVERDAYCAFRPYVELADGGMRVVASLKIDR